MSSIVTITFSPCIDQSASIAALIPEKKLQCYAVRSEPGGGGINVARAIKKIGGYATAIFPSGGYTGKHLNHLIEKENVPTSIIEASSETRENIIIFDESSGYQYRFGMPPPELSEHEWKECLEALDKIIDVKFIVVSGRLPPGVPFSVFGLLKKIAARKNAKLIVDTSGDALREAVKQGVYLIKPNRAELCALAGLDSIENIHIADAARSVIQKYGCEVIVVSLGKDGAVLVSNDEIHQTLAPDVKTISTVGAGDSMVAGIVYSLAKGSDFKHILQFGVACGTAATMNPGTELCHAEDVDNLYSTIGK